MSDATDDLYSFLRSKDLLFSAGERRSNASAEDEASQEEAASVGGASSKDVADTANASPAPVALDFDDDSVGERLRDLDTAQRNRAPFGIIRIDDDGVVQFYNRYESELSGVDPEDAVGRNFFTQLAPCSNNRVFLGRFQRGLQTGDLDERFTYTFTYKMRPTLVDIRLYRDDAGNNWILVKRR